MADHEIVTLLRTANVESLLGDHGIPWLCPDPDVSLQLARFAVFDLAGFRRILLPSCLWVCSGRVQSPG